MSNTNKSTKLYKTPFSPAYWRDAAAELKDTKMLVFAALLFLVEFTLIHGFPPTYSAVRTSQ